MKCFKPGQTRCNSTSCLREDRCLDAPMADVHPESVAATRLAMVAKFPVPEPTHAHQVTPLQLLETLLDEVRCGKRDPHALIIVEVAQEGAGFRVSNDCAGPLSFADVYVYLDAAKMQVLRELEI